MTPPVLRRLQPQDAADYRALMLDAYQREPEAFTSSHAERAGAPLTWWQARLAPDDDAADLVLGAWDGTELVGATGLRFESREKTRHKATLFGMVVAPAWRGQGIGRVMLEGALAQAQRRPGVRLVQLTVSEGNSAAQALYEAAGFAGFGLEPMAVMLEEDRFVAKRHMWLELSPAPAAE